MTKIVNYGVYQRIDEPYNLALIFYSDGKPRVLWLTSGRNSITSIPSREGDVLKCWDKDRILKWLEDSIYLGSLGEVALKIKLDSNKKI